MNKNRQTLSIDEELYADNDDVLYILRRLKEAASDSKLRHDMNVEDEYFSAIEHRDTEILMRDKVIAEQNTQIAEQREQLISSIKLLLANKVPAEVIAQTLNIDISIVNNYL